MSNFRDLKKVTSILLSFSFLVNCVMMPFCNFQDTVSAKILYGLFLQKDGDGDVFEFIANDMLHMGSLFEDEEEEDHENKIPQQEHPSQPIQISPGFLYCAQSILIEEKEVPATPRVFSSFVNNTYKFNLSKSVFHPPSVPAAHFCFSMTNFLS